MPGVVAYPGRDHFAGEVSESEVAERARAGGPLRVLSVANVLPGKGLHFALEALLRLPAGSWRWTVAGSLTMDSSYAGRLRRQIERAGVADRVELLGTVAHDEIPRLLAASDVMVVPSTYEGAGDRVPRSDGLRRAGRRLGRRWCRRDRRARPRGVPRRAG